MKKLISFLVLVRSLNLVFILLTQLLFYYCIVMPTYESFQRAPILDAGLFYILVLASVLIAAGGYVINDYFDLNIDKINKPKRMVIDKSIGRRWAMFFHMTMSVTGLLLSGFIAWKIKNVFLFGFNACSILLLWYYSTTLKKKLLIGNVVISLLTAWVIGVILLCEFNTREIQDPIAQAAFIKIYKMAVLYGGFAFVISMIREIIKDMEDADGDRKYGCKTVPIVWGFSTAKILVLVLLVFLLAVFVVFMGYALLQKWIVIFVFLLLIVFFQLIPVMRAVQTGNTSEAYHRISNKIKLLMLSGIGSMLLFYFYSL
jgi:4-hydroxybenzoate polyprenyltransferase